MKSVSVIQLRKHLYRSFMVSAEVGEEPFNRCSPPSEREQCSFDSSQVDA